MNKKSWAAAGGTAILMLASYGVVQTTLGSDDPAASTMTQAEEATKLKALLSDLLVAVEDVSTELQVTLTPTTATPSTTAATTLPTTATTTSTLGAVTTDTTTATPSTTDAATTTTTSTPGVTTTTSTPIAVTSTQALLAELRTAVENDSDYERSDYKHYRRYLCDTAGIDPYTGLWFDSDTCHVDHIVAVKEAHESGGHAWDDATRSEFGDDALNLVASRDCVNQSKGSRDPAEWSGVQSGICGGAVLTTAGQCFWATRTVNVKSRYDLTVDAAERVALSTSLTNCSS